MKTRFGSLLFVGVLVAVSLSAATKTSGTATCKMDPASPPPVAVSDQPNHALAIGKAQCTWTGFSVAGQAYKDGAKVQAVLADLESAPISGGLMSPVASSRTARMGRKRP